MSCSRTQHGDACCYMYVNNIFEHADNFFIRKFSRIFRGALRIMLINEYYHAYMPFILDWRFISSNNVLESENWL